VQLRLKFTKWDSERSFLGIVTLADYSERQTLPVYPSESEIIDTFNTLLYDIFDEEVEWLV
jgi:hypothetical protein